MLQVSEQKGGALGAAVCVGGVWWGSDVSTCEDKCDSAVGFTVISAVSDDR
jgi:hypothetical protein